VAEPRRIPETMAEVQLYQELQAMASVMATHMPQPGYVYQSILDFVLQHGAFFRAVSAPAGYFRGPPKCCYGNSLAAVFHDTRDVEGWGLIRVGGEPRLALPHAWVTPGDGLAYEVTAPEPWLAYWGTEFRVERADHCSWDGDASVLDDDRRRHPLLRQRWPGEDWGKAWPYSPRLTKLRRKRPRRKRRG
jgi:hypothetical protein